MADTLLAIDWGTTNRRIYRIEAGAVVHTHQDGLGVTSVTDFDAAVGEVRGQFGDHPMLMAGMVGSSIGWRVAPYVAAPAGISELAAKLMRVDARTAIVPGVSTTANGRADVMRGEEVQLLGAIAAGLVPPDAVLVQPGTHSKWARMADGRIAGFSTAMTGELFALLRGHGVLAQQLGGDPALGPAFLDGVADARDRRDLLTDLFGIRAAGLLGMRADGDAPAYASGLLIGTEVAARLSETDADRVHILAGNALGRLYVAAIEAHGRQAVLIDSSAAFVAGVTALQGFQK
ncbi:2-dehydro-3-deoxygalactonokinase [Sphingomonas sp. FW199]|uniref:2-dehydro-3-deoxygalactonokinase n=1 Tax=Sphingomonas sp. FW199 TaxID=3400217 RepID=UPI003CF021EC